MLADLMNLGFEVTTKQQVLELKNSIEKIEETDIYYDIPWIRYHGMGYSQIVIEYSFSGDTEDTIPSLNSSEHKYHLLTIGGSDALDAEINLRDMLKVINSITNEVDPTLLSWYELLIVAEYTAHTSPLISNSELKKRLNLLLNNGYKQ